MSTISKDARIYVAGHAGLVGSAVTRRLRGGGYTNLLTAERDDLDLRDQGAVNRWFETNRPEYVFLVAGTVGGILANSARPAEFIYDNLMIHATVVHAAYREGVRKLLYLGSSCIYPRECPQPMKEEYLLTGLLEPTNEPYAVAKIAGIKLCQAYRHQYGCDFISAMPTNLYGPNDNFDLTSSHVLPALIRKFHDAMGGVRSSSGAPGRPDASSCTWTTSPTRASSSWSTTTGTSTSTWVPGRTSRSSSWPRWSATSSSPRQVSPSTPPSPTALLASSSTFRASTASAGTTESACATASRRRTSGSWITMRKSEAGSEQQRSRGAEEIKTAEGQRSMGERTMAEARIDGSGPTSW
jgi:hypothetical protein